jgi:hypothetical protein
MRALKLHNDNGTIIAYITETPTPAIGTLVCVHGGPGGDHRGNNDIFEAVAKYCGGFGYNIVQFDMYGAGQSEGTAADITLRTQLTDYEYVLDHTLRTLPRPIHVVGESMGATIAALDWKSDVSTHLLLWPAFDLKDTDLKPYLSDDWSKKAIERGYVEDNGMVMGREFLREVATVDFSKCFNLPSKPSLIVHGKRDSAVPFKQSLDAVARATGECVLFAHPEGDHGLQRPSERQFTHDAIKWWLKRVS